MKSILLVASFLFSFSVFADQCTDPFYAGLNYYDMGNEKFEKALDHFNKAKNELNRNNPNMVTVCWEINRSAESFGTAAGMYRLGKMEFIGASATCNGQNRANAIKNKGICERKETNSENNRTIMEDNHEKFCIDKFDPEFTELTEIEL